jgi:hypothetical protein
METLISVAGLLGVLLLSLVVERLHDQLSSPQPVLARRAGRARTPRDQPG